MEAFKWNRGQAVEASLVSDVVATAMFEFMLGRREWDGTAGDLLEAILDHVNALKRACAEYLTDAEAKARSRHREDPNRHGLLGVG